MKGNEEKSEKSFSFPYRVVALSSSLEHLPHPPPLPTKKPMYMFYKARGKCLISNIHSLKNLQQEMFPKCKKFVNAYFWSLGMSRGDEFTLDEQQKR